MLFRFVDIDLAKFPLLRWRWFVEMGIDSAIDERTREGDDHPACLFLTFVGEDGERCSMEIIWGNRHLKAGDGKMLGTFPHFVANGGTENIGAGMPRGSISWRSIDAIGNRPVAPA